MKSGNLNFLEPSGPLQAGNGADFFTLTFLPDLLMQQVGESPHCAQLKIQYYNPFNKYCFIKVLL
jgi:hypothetical protein